MAILGVRPLRAPSCRYCCYVQQELMEMRRPQGETGVNVILPTCEPDETIGMLKKTSKQPSDDTRVASGPGTRFSKGSVTYQTR